MKFGDFFEKEWICDFAMVSPCWSAEGKKQLSSIHERCGWQYTAKISEKVFEELKDARLVK